MKTEEELMAMKHCELKAYAKEIGCCLGYDASRKDTMRAAILRHQQHIENGGKPKSHPWRKRKSATGGDRA